MHQLFFLTGFMASGKTKNGRIMAQRLGLPFVDLDELIKRHTNQTINAYFDKYGEQSFRQLELESLQALPEETMIVALGGGTFSNSKSMEWIQGHGVSIFLDTPIATLYSRLLANKATRPLIKDLKEQELFDKLSSLRRKRLADYQQADYTIPYFCGSERDRKELAYIIQTNENPKWA